MTLCMHYLKEAEGRNECWGWNAICICDSNVFISECTEQCTDDLSCSLL